jgi:hypothetical protein
MTPRLPRPQVIEISRDPTAEEIAAEKPPRARSATIRRRISLLAAVIALGVAVSACGAGSALSPSVAGSGGTAEGTSASSSSGNLTPHAAALRYAQCMRTHGIADFPDPSGNGGFLIHAGPGSDLNNNNPSFEAAVQACRQYRPVVNLTPAQHANLESEYLSFAHCMRSHDISDFPDPVTGRGDGVGFSLQGGPNSDLSSANPAFEQAVESCQHILGHRFEFAFGSNGVGKGS